MHQKFEVKVKYHKVDENGKQLMATETYIVEGLTFGHVEEIIYKEIEPYVSGDFTVESIRRSRFSEIHFTPDGDRFFKAVIAFISIDEDKGIARKSKLTVLVQANELDKVKPLVDDRFKGVVTDFEVVSVSETAIIDVIILPEQTETEE